VSDRDWEKASPGSGLVYGIVACHWGELELWFGRADTDSFPALAKGLDRGEARNEESSKWRQQGKSLETELDLRTENKG